MIDTMGNERIDLQVVCFFFCRTLTCRRKKLLITHFRFNPVGGFHVAQLLGASRRTGDAHADDVFSVAAHIDITVDSTI